MLAINYAFFALLILNLGGTSPNLKSFKDYNPASNTKLFKQDSDSDSCIYIILKLLSKSDFRKDDLLDDSEFSFDKLTYTVENIIDDSIIVIHAYLSPALNDSEPHDRTVEWLQLDLKKKLLEDASIDPANPIILNFDKEFLKEINIDCLTESNKKYFQEMNK